jgi:hypothetical protein
MSRTTTGAVTEVPPEEVARRIAEYCRLGFQRKAPAQVVYHGSNARCPWPDCGARIAGIHFQLEKLGDRELYERLLASWWQGPGLVGRCPECGRYVLFSVTSKQAVTDPAAMGPAVLPDDWQKTAHIVMRPPS